MAQENGLPTLDELLAEAEKAQPDDQANQQEAQNANAPPLKEEKATASPGIDADFLARLPQLLTAVKPLLAWRQVPADDKPKEEKPPSDWDRRIALLRAIRPYLNRERQNAIDRMVQMRGLGEALETMLHAEGKNDVHSE